MDNGTILKEEENLIETDVINQFDYTSRKKQENGSLTSIHLPLEGKTRYYKKQIQNEKEKQFKKAI